MIFPIARAYVAPEVVVVTDDDVRRAQSVLWSGMRVVAEPGGSAAFAALLFRVYQSRPGEWVAGVDLQRQYN